MEKNYSFCSVGSQHFSHKSFRWTLLSKSHSDQNLIYINCPTLGFWLMYLAARLKNKQKRMNSWWWCGGMQGHLLFVAWNPKLGGRTTGLSLNKGSPHRWFEANAFGFFFFNVCVFNWRIIALHYCFHNDLVFLSFEYNFSLSWYFVPSGYFTCYSTRKSIQQVSLALVYI